MWKSKLKAKCHDNCSKENEKLRYILNSHTLNKWSDIPYPWIGKLNIVKMTIFPKLIYSLIQFLSKLEQGFW